MNQPEESIVKTPQGDMRIWQKGKGAKLGVISGVGGAPKWSPFLEALSQTREVVVPSLPGFPGGALSEGIDDHLDWIVATHDALVAADLIGADLLGCSVGGALAAEIASLYPKGVRRLVLVAPFGMFDEDDPIADMFAQPPGMMSAILSTKPKEFDAYLATPEGTNRGDWEIDALRARVAAAEIIWPLGDTGLRKRISRLAAPTLIVWGESDRTIPPSYARKFAAAIKAKSEIKLIAGAGHVAEFDQPDAVASAVEAFLRG